jgi:putative transposase
MSRMAPKIVLAPSVREVLESLKRSRSLPQHLGERARFILWSADGELCSVQARKLGVDPQRVRRWRTRWAQRTERLNAALEKGATGAALRSLVLELLSDNYRCGVTPKFSAEQVAAIIALGCEDPGDHGLPVTHWTPKELTAKAKERGIVEDISPRHVGRFLKRGAATAAHVALLAQSQASRPTGVQEPSGHGVRDVSECPGT